MRYSPCWQLDHKSPNQPLETLFLDVTSTRSRLWLTFCCRPYVYAMHSEQPDIYGHKTGPMSTDVSTLYLHKRLVACLWKACSKGTSKMFVWRMTRSVCSSWTSLWGWLTKLSASSWMDSSRWNCTAVSTSSWSGITVRTHTPAQVCAEVLHAWGLQACSARTAASVKQKLIQNNIASFQLRDYQWLRHRANGGTQIKYAQGRSSERRWYTLKQLM